MSMRTSDEGLVVSDFDGTSVIALTYEADPQSIGSLRHDAVTRTWPSPQYNTATLTPSRTDIEWRATALAYGGSNSWRSRHFGRSTASDSRLAGAAVQAELEEEEKRS